MTKKKDAGEGGGDGIGYDPRVDYDALIEDLKARKERQQKAVEETSRAIRDARTRKSKVRRRYDTHVKTVLGGLLLKAYGLDPAEVRMDAFAMLLDQAENALSDGRPEKVDPPRLPSRAAASVDKLPVREARERMGAWERSEAPMGEWGRTVCPRCGAPVRPKADKCWKCRESIVPAVADGWGDRPRRCRQCYTELEPGTAACPVCGHRAVWDAGPAAPAPVRQAPSNAQSGNPAAGSGRTGGAAW